MDLDLKDCIIVKQDVCDISGIESYISDGDESLCSDVSSTSFNAWIYTVIEKGRVCRDFRMDNSLKGEDDKKGIFKWFCF